MSAQQAAWSRRSQTSVSGSLIVEESIHMQEHARAAIGSQSTGSEVNIRDFSCGYAETQTLRTPIWFLTDIIKNLSQAIFFQKKQNIYKDLWKKTN